MSKKSIILIVAAALIVIAAVVARFCLRDTDVVGVTSYPNKNTVVLCCKSGSEFVNGSGSVTVGEGEYIHLEYALQSGSFDSALHAGDGSLDVFRDADMTKLPETAEDGGVFGTSGVSGKGGVDYEVAPGSYTVFFTIHDTVGKATVSVRKK